MLEILFRSYTSYEMNVTCKSIKNIFYYLINGDILDLPDLSDYESNRKQN